MESILVTAKETESEVKFSYYLDNCLTTESMLMSEFLEKGFTFPKESALMEMTVVHAVSDLGCIVSLESK